LTRGSNVEGGKGRIYGYLTGSHNSKEKADFLKNEYGIGGSSHSVSGRGWIDSSGKGIRLQKPDCADVELNWNKVLTRFENLIRNGRYFTPEQKAKYEEMQTREGQFRKLMDAYNDIKHEHPDDIVLFQVGDFFEMYGEDAKTAAKLLDLNLTTHPVAGAGRVEMCGIPAHNLEQSVEKLRATHGVTVSEFNGIVNEHISRSLPVLPAVEELSQEPEIEPVSVTEAPNESPSATVEAPVVSREITQAEIDEALQRWNGDIESKRSVVRYMADHARERDTAAWLSKEYGGDVSKPLHITVTGTDIDYEMSWAKVQRRVAQLIKEDRFYTQEEYDRLDDIDPVYIRAELAQRGIVNGELVEPEKLDNDPFIQQVNADVKSLSESVEAWEAEQEAKRNEAIARLTDEQQTIVEAMNVAGYVYQHNVGYSGEPIVFYANTDSYPISFANWNDAYDWIDNAELKLEPGLRDKVQAVLHPDEPPRMTDAEFAAEHLVPRESTYEIDGRRFIVDSVNLDFGSVSLQDVTFQNQTGFPIFRSESIEFMRRLVEISEAQRTAELPAEPTSAEPKPELHNFQITDDHLGEGGAKAKFRMNMDAINLLKELEFDGRQATPEEQVILSKYVGWGGLADAFDETKDNWKNEFAELYATLSPEEYAAARSSTLNAHFTSPTVIKAIYEAVGNMGFETGNILEPSMGVGNFFGCLPEAMQNSKLYGVELDSITGRIAKQLYPKADITIAGFETTDRRDFYDLAIGNVPFGQYQVNDRAYNKLGFSIHDYFFAKALDQVRPGGVVAFVTSRYTMDKQSPEVRKYIAQRADLLGAIRLPNNAFKANAGTEVVSDIIFLQKRDRPIEIEPDWVHLGKNDDGFAINSYFLDNPEMVLGRQTSESTQYGKQDFTVEPYENLDLGVQLKYAIQNINGTYTEAELPELGEGEAIDTSIPADPNVKNYSYTVVDGDVYYRENSRMVKPELNATATERVKGMVELRDCVQKLIGQQMDGFVSDASIRETQRELNDLYDKFTAKHGLINSRGNALAFADDSSYYLLCSLEVLDEDNNLKRKADMFTKRTIKPSEVVTSVDTAAEALAVSIAEKARVDMEYMSSLTGKSEEELASDLRSVIYMDFNRKPDGSYTWRTADDFLSGNVREKLAYYQKALDLLPEDANHRNEIADNVEALKMAQPKELDASEIEVRLGATWIDKSYIQQFMVETFEPPYYLRRSIEVNYSPFSAEWNITGKSQPSYSDVNAYMTYGTDRANAYKILEDTLNLRDVRIYDTVTDPDGKERRVLNAKETTLAQQKQQAIKDAFQDWIWRDPDRRQELVTKYNELFNSNRPREYDGSHIVFSGMNPEIKLREHQRGAVAHILYGGNTLLAHEVGAGKTFEMVAAAMESKRLGLCQKPLFVVPNHLTEQWASEFLRLYPSANILAATKKDFEPRNRKKFCGRIATGDYDAIIIGHSQFERIPVSQERQERLLQEQIAEIEEGLEELKASRAERFTIKSLERTKKGLETRLQKLQDSSRKDDVITFEQLGVDRLYVDEAHNYKNLFLYTKMRNVAGLSTTDAQKSSDMLLKCRYIDEITDNRGVVFATGTPVSNSMTELYTMMRYLQHDTIRGKGLAHFDCWASTFGETTTAIELAPEGTGYRARTRFAKFFNLPELMNLFKEAADIKTADQLNLPTPTPIYHNEVAQPTEIQKAMVQELSERAAAVHSGKVDPSVDNMLRITSDGRKLGLDQRIINPNLPDEPTSKVNMCVDNIHRIWEDGHADKLTQLVFCDLSTPKNTPSKRAAKAPAGNLDSPEIRALEHLAEKDGGTEEEQRFTVYDDIRDKLVERGIPREQIAFIHEANTEARKKELFSKVRSGQVRVLMGSTFKMGAGMNVQDRLIALHDLDAPWRPGDLEQRSGRIIRQGNMNPEVHIYRYVTEATFDAYLWQTLENKQKFISQIMTSKSPVRACDDIDETALSYAEIKALCAGDERIKEKMDLDVDVARLKLMKANHQSQQYRLEDNLLRYFPEQIEQNKKFIEGFNADMKTLAEHPHPVDGFAGMTVRGDVLTDKENAGAALVDAFKDVKGLDPVQIGTYRGFTMSLTLEDFGRDYVLTLKGQMTHRVTLGKDPRGNLTRIDNTLNGMAERLTTVQGKLDSLYAQMETAKQELGRPFPQETELKAKSARLAELNIALNIDDKTPLEAMAEEAPPRAEIAKSAKPSVLQKLHSYDKPSKADPLEPKKSKEEVR
jgi:N12 class adenine-specific DNA methylase